MARLVQADRKGIEMQITAIQLWYEGEHLCTYNTSNLEGGAAAEEQ